MNLDQLQHGLEQAFFKEGHRIVFWYDPECDFESDLSTIELPDVNVVNMNGQSSLGIKLKLELENTQSKYLLYFPIKEPVQEKDWLLDIKLYSRSFKKWGQSKYPVVYALARILLAGLTRRPVNASTSVLNFSVPSTRPLFNEGEIRDRPRF